jgi:hypothetical protein
VNDAINVVCADYVFDLVVIADISFNKWDLYAVVCAQVGYAGLEALVARVVDDNSIACADKFIGDVCADISSTACK